MDVVGPMEKTLLAAYSLEHQGRKINSPKNNLPLAKALAEVDQNPLTGNNDGQTTINEWRSYLSWVASYDTQNYWNQDNYLVEKVLPQLREELKDLGEVVGIKAPQPFDDPKKRVEKYTTSNIMLLYLLENPEADPVLAQEVKKNGLRAVEEKKNPQLFNKLQNSYQQVKISDKKKWEYLNKLINYNAFLNVKYTPEKTDHSRKEIGQVYTPAEILAKKGSIAINCLEVSSLAVVMARALDIPANLYEVKIAGHSSKIENFNGQDINIPEIIYHMVVELLIDGEKVIFDPSYFPTGRESAEILANEPWPKIYKDYHLYVKQHDLLSELSAFYLFSATMQIKTQEEVLYNDNLVELSYLIDPTNVPPEYSDYTIVYNYYSDSLHLPFIRSDLFYSLAKDNDNNQYLIESYLDQFKFQLNAIKRMEKYTKISDGRYSKQVLENLSKLKPIDLPWGKFYIE